MKSKKETNTSQSAPSEVMIAQVQVIGGGPDEVKQVSEYLKNFVDNNDIKIKFVVSNENVELRSVDWLLAELNKLKEENERKS